jgi:hypothetical protein
MLSPYRRGTIGRVQGALAEVAVTAEQRSPSHGVEGAVAAACKSPSERGGEDGAGGGSLLPPFPTAAQLHSSVSARYPCVAVSASLDSFWPVRGRRLTGYFLRWPLDANERRMERLRST